MTDKLFRPSDFSLFIEVEPGLYTHEMNIPRLETHNVHKYKKRHLLQCGFKPVVSKEHENDLKKLKEEYYEYLKWECKSDGHGGFESKGTIKDYRKLNQKFKKCKVCKGTGADPYWEAGLNPDLKSCYKCNGSGKIKI